MALTSKWGRGLYWKALMENLSVSLKAVLSVYDMLHEEHINTNLVKTLFVDKHEGSRVETILESHVRLIGFPDGPDFRIKPTREAFYEGLLKAVQSIYEKLDSLETLIIHDPLFTPQFLRAQEPRQPLRFLTNTLKKLYIPFSGLEGEVARIFARNAVWLLIFCPRLEVASLGFNIDQKDFGFLKEYQNVFEGLSRIKELALHFCFDYDQFNPMTWWGLEGEEYRVWQGRRNKKTEAIHRLLRVTNRLYSLELFSSSYGKRPEDDSHVHPNCLLALDKSFDSLKHLRLFSMPNLDFAFDHRLLKGLLHLAWCGASLSMTNESEQFDLPPNLQVISMPFYARLPANRGDDRFLEEDFLVRLFQNTVVPNLKEVVVPDSPFQVGGIPMVEGKEVWIRRRKALESLEMFKSGKVKLTKWKIGDVSE